MTYENIDKYGHCVVCHKGLLIERVVDGKAVKIFSPDKEESEFLLDDGSRMRVCICRGCKKDVDLSNEDTQKIIMEAVINGWDLEVKSLVEDNKKPDWDSKRGKEYMDVYKKRNIVLYADKVEKHVIANRIENIKKEKGGKP